ncbi:Ankyrin repeat-containing protein [Quillaja saponaria]|uniref:Ankyrin repeat-containing protein n=1 Tax=Quillaja saponaria TaxID=32244 RepID=A0AAD7Q7M4_QUISA|nr:Ankyrin repeat-containing protein [Quillaja saponaria]
MEPTDRMEVKLCKAGIQGNSNSFNNFIDGNNCSNLYEVTAYGKTVLHLAPKSGKTDVAKKILKVKDLKLLILYRKNKNDETGLHIAARLGYFDFLKLLMDQSKEEEVETGMKLLRFENKEGNTVLHKAARNGHLNIVDLLLKEDPILLILVNKAAESPFFVAVDRGLFKIAMLMLQTDSPDGCSHLGGNNMNALHAAVLRKVVFGNNSSLGQLRRFSTIWSFLIPFLYIFTPLVKKETLQAKFTEMETLKMKVLFALIVVLMAVQNVKAVEAPAPSPTSDATTTLFVPTMLASLLALAIGLLF